tara:strand:+ start:312 stop:566 length:255 start_codon:yes stop_codon:yes gene_type:complete
MEIESKIEDDKWVIIRKEPEPGDLVQYKYHPRNRELGLVVQTYDAGIAGDELALAHVMWGTNDEEDELFLDLQVVSTANVFYDS